MPDIIYTAISNSLAVIVLVFFAHYIFFLPRPKDERILYICMGIVFIGTLLMPTLSALILCVVCIYFFYCHEGYKLQGFLITFPVLGLYYGLYSLNYYSYLFIPQEICLYVNFIFEIIIPLFVLAIIMFSTNWRESFDLELQFRSINKGLHIFIIIVSLLLGASHLFIMCCNRFLNNDQMIIYAIGTSVIIFVVSICTIVFIVLMDQRSYFNALATLNQQYLNTELAHFDAYKKTQNETRKIRQSMQENMFTLEYLIDNENMDKALEHLNSLRTSVERISPAINTGHNLADAICNEKYHIAKEKGITFSAEGKFPSDMNIDNVDLCTIMANALDNAIEATEKLPEKDRWIKLDVKIQGAMLLLTFTNPTENTNTKVGKTTKKDSINHGFGLQNIKQASKKNKGSIDIEIINESDVSLFVLTSMFTYKK